MIVRLLGFVVIKFSYLVPQVTTTFYQENLVLCYVRAKYDSKYSPFSLVELGKLRIHLEYHKICSDHFAGTSRVKYIILVNLSQLFHFKSTVKSVKSIFL